MSIKRLIRRPSPALIVACCALFVALGGTSYALATGAIGSREIRNGSIQSVDVANRALRGQKLALDAVGGNAVKEQSLDPAKLDASRLHAASADGLAAHALVDATGAVVRSRGVKDVEHLRVGRYQVIFDRDVSACVTAATIYDDIEGPGQIGTFASQGGTDLRSEANIIYVSTGTSTGEPADRPFSLIVSC